MSYSVFCVCGASLSDLFPKRCDEEKGTQCGDTEKSGGHLHWRYEKMKGVRHIEGIMSEEVSDTFLDQTRLSILSWNAGRDRTRVSSCV